ncbi:hypothetical protein [Chitinophaga sp. YIM B06452]|uniref:hypothetical protein n=1 Tax=Chitinophaga sp. YIM B06452 TaxID=3082158 RepID=UPI0031FF3F79
MNSDIHPSELLEQKLLAFIQDIKPLGVNLVHLDLHVDQRLFSPKRAIQSGTHEMEFQSYMPELEDITAIIILIAKGSSPR